MTLVTPTETRILENQTVHFEAIRVNQSRETVDKPLVNDRLTDYTGTASYGFGFRLRLSNAGHEFTEGEHVRAKTEYGAPPETCGRTVYDFPTTAADVYREFPVDIAISLLD